MVQDVLDRFDAAIDARILEYDAFFAEKLADYVAAQGLVEAENASGVQSCPSGYFPTHPQVSSTKIYEFGLYVNLNGPVRSTMLVRDNTDLMGDEGIPTIAELSVAVMEAAGEQNAVRPGSHHSSSSFCVLPQNPSRIRPNASNFVSDCRHVYRYSAYLMSDTYTDIEGNMFRGFWIVQPHFDPNHSSLIDESSANAYGNSLGRTVEFVNQYQQVAGDTYEVRCDQFDYIMPLRAGDEAEIANQVDRAASTHIRTGINDMLFRRP